MQQRNHPKDLIPRRLPGAVGFGLALAGSLFAQTRSLESLLKEGLHQEQTLRQPDTAVQTYREVIAMAESRPDILAEAHVRLGACLERLGRTEEARKQYEQIVDRFQDQAVVLERAKRRLAAISAGDPAALLPADTALYVELVRPGLQAERFAASLRGVDVAGLQRLLARFGLEQDLRKLRATFTEALREDINQIDSLALGIVSLEELPGRTDAKFLLSLHPGKSVASRGVLALMAQSAGEADGSHRGVKLWAIPDGDTGQLTFANLPRKPGLGGVMLLGKDHDLVCQAIDRWKGGLDTPSLSTLPEFRRQAAARRMDSALLVYADVPRILARVQQAMRPSDRNRLEASRRLLALDAIERGMARVALLDNGLVIELSLMFGEGPNPFYTMLRTPPADRSLLEFVPTGAAVSALMSVGEGRDKADMIWTFLGQLARLRRLMGDPNPEEISNVILRIESITGLALGDDVLANCRSLAVILPTISPLGGTQASSSPAANVVLVMRMFQPDDFGRRVQEALPTPPKVRVIRGEIVGVPVSTYTVPAESEALSMSLARVDDVFLVSMKKSMLEDVLTARKQARIVTRSALGRPVVGSIPPSASKIVLIHPERVLNDLRAMWGLPPLPFSEVQPVLAYTLEQERQVALRIEVGDLTGLLNNAILAAGAATPTTAASEEQVATTRPARPHGHR